MKKTLLLSLFLLLSSYSFAYWPMNENVLSWKVITWKNKLMEFKWKMFSWERLWLEIGKKFKWMSEEKINYILENIKKMPVETQKQRIDHLVQKLNSQIELLQRIKQKLEDYRKTLN